MFAVRHAASRRRRPVVVQFALRRAAARVGEQGASVYSGRAPVKKEAALSYRSPLMIAATLAAAVGGTLPNAASARDYKIGCANGACVIVDDTGRISFFTIGDKKLSDSDDQLKPSALGRIRPPLNISCGAGSGGDVCVVTDADGDVWEGPTRPGAAFGAPVARLPTPGPR